MKIFIGIAGFLVVLILVNIGKVLIIDNGVNSVNKTIEDFSLKNKENNDKNFADLQRRSKENYEKAKKVEDDNKKVKVFVKGLSIKECMSKLNTNEINDWVYKCNKNHYVEMKNSEVEQFKKENE